jgi:hypothetical protein
MAEYLRVRVGVVSGFDQVDSLASSDSTCNPFLLRKPSFTPSFTPMLISHMLGITDHSKRSHRSNTSLNGAERSKFIGFRGRQSALLPPTYLSSKASLVQKSLRNHKQRALQIYRYTIQLDPRKIPMLSRTRQLSGIAHSLTRHWTLLFHGTKKGCINKPKK